MNWKKKIFAFLPSRRIGEVLADPKYQSKFKREIDFNNFTRLRYLTYFLLALNAFLLYSDFYMGHFWESRHLNIFMKLDLVLLILTIYVFLITHIKRPENPDQIKSIHDFHLKVYLIIHVCWCAAVGVVEAQTGSNTPTFILGIFGIITLFLFRGFFIIFLLLISIATLYGGMALSGMTSEEIFVQFSTVPTLVLLAFVISRLLLNTRISSFIATQKLEIAKDGLDQQVKDRTQELSETNAKLLQEIKEREKYERGLRREKKKAEEADYLKSVFLANMSHEIRTPLNGILGFSDLLNNPTVSEQKRKKYINIINNNGQQLLKIIDDIIDISMIESNQMAVNKVPFKIRHILNDSLDFFTTFSKRENKDHIMLKGKMPLMSPDETIHSDPTRLQQVIYNLIKNAFKFTNEGHITLGYRIDEGIIMFFVEDTGIGIPLKKDKVIFERFRQGEETLTRTYGGTGLGLSISKGIVEKLLGQIWLDSSYVDGARFCFTIPYARKGNDSLIDQSDVHIKKLFKSHRDKSILIVNASESTFNYVDRLLQPYKLIVHYTETPEKTAEFIENGPQTDLIVFSSDFSKQDQLEIEAIHEKSPDLPILAFTSSEVKPSLMEKTGCKDYLALPLNKPLFLMKVAYYLSN